MTVNVSYQDFSLNTAGKVMNDKKFVKAQLELTYGCNLHCVHCYTDPLNRPDLLKKELPTQEILEVIDKLHSEGIFWLALTGGEIFYRKDFFQIYNYAYEKGFLMTLFTNGTLITEEVANRLVERPPFSIEISFHGSNAKTFDKITQVQGSFEKCVKGIKFLLERKLPLKLKTKAMTWNQGELKEIKQFVEDFGLKFSVNGVIQPRLDGDTSSTNYRMNVDEMLDMEFSIGPYEDECRMVLQEGVESEVRHAKAPQNIYRCGCGVLQTHIDPYGKVGTCTWSREDRFDFREKKLQDGMQELADKINAQLYSKDSDCHECEAFMECEKMPEMAAYETGSIQAPVQHFCDLAFGRKERVEKRLDELKKDNQ